MMMTIKEITNFLDAFAPPQLQESYDNSGLLVGEPGTSIENVLVSLDCTEEVVEEAIQNGIGLIICHHPIIFGGMKKLTGENYVERTVMKALRNNIGIYATHTNLDNIPLGVNARISERLGLENTRILAPKKGMFKLAVFCPTDHADNVRKAVFDVGAGAIGDYDECSFNVRGTGTFRPGNDADPYVGEKGKQHQEEEEKIEVVFPFHRKSQVLNAMFEAHPYEEVAHDVFVLENRDPEAGSGMIGDLAKPLEEKEFLELVKKNMQTGCVRYTPLLGKKVEKVAVCGGAGSFLLQDAIRAKADVLVTSDFKYHQFFDAEGRILIADVGHYESEQFTVDLLAEKLQTNFPKFAVRKTQVNTNPVNYF